MELCLQTCVFLLFLIRTDDVEQLVGAGGVAGVVGAVLVVPAVLHAGEINRGGGIPGISRQY